MRFLSRFTFILFFPILFNISSSLATPTYLTPSYKKNLAKALLKKGMKNLSQENLNMAETAFKESLKNNPVLVSAILGLAEIAQKKGEIKEVEKHLQKAVRIAPKSSSAQIAWARYLFSQKRMYQAEGAYKKAVSLNPESVKLHIEIGTFYLNGPRKPEEAVKSYRAALAIDPEHAGAHHALGVTLITAGQIDQAELELKEAGRLDPNNLLTFQALGFLYMNSKEFDKALETFSLVVQAHPGDIQAYLARGDIFMFKNEYDNALVEYSKVLEIDSGLSFAHFKIGLLHDRCERKDKAEEAYRTAIKYNPKQASAYNNLAWLFAKQKIKLDNALMLSNKALELVPENAKYLDTLGWVYRARGELDKAASTLKKAADIQHQMPVIFYHLGVVYAEKGDSKIAIATFKKALELKKNFEGAEDARQRLSTLDKL